MLHFFFFLNLCCLYSRERAVQDLRDIVGKLERENRILCKDTRTISGSHEVESLQPGHHMLYVVCVNCFVKSPSCRTSFLSIFQVVFIMYRWTNLLSIFQVVFIMHKLLFVRVVIVEKLIAQQVMWHSGMVILSTSMIFYKLLIDTKPRCSIYPFTAGTGMPLELMIICCDPNIFPCHLMLN